MTSNLGSVVFALHHVSVETIGAQSRTPDIPIVKHTVVPTTNICQIFIMISFVITSHFKKYQLQLKRYSLKLCQTESHLGSCFVSVLHYQNRSPHDKAWNWAAVESTTPRLEERGNKKRKTRGTTNVLSSFFFSFSDPQQVAALFLMQPNSPLSLQRHTHTHKPKQMMRPFFFIMAELPSIFFFFALLPT